MNHKTMTHNTKHLLRAATLLAALLLCPAAWGQTAPVEITTEADIANNSKKLYLIQTNAFQSFYMVPNGVNVNTNNIPGEYMLWYFLDAGIDNGTQYYYIVSNSENKYICHAGGTDGNKRTVTLVEKDASNEERCKFKLVENGTGFYNINAKGNPTYYGLNKQGGSQASTNPVRLTNSQYISDGNSKWKFILFDGTFTWPEPPFTVSTDLDKHYYKIHNVQNGTYYVSTDATPDKVTYASTETNNMVWYFKEASSDSWFKYYYLVNPEADKYMYYSGTTTNGSDQTSAVSVKTYDSGGEDRYQFVVVQAARGDGASRVECYAIIPKLLTGNLWTSNSLGPKTNGVGNMGIISSRSADNKAQWQFNTSDYPLRCAAPTVTYSSATGKITITATTPSSAIHYTTDGAEPSSSSTTYSSPFVVSAATTIKAIATKNGYWDSEVTTKSFSQVETPTIQNNGSNAISITCATTGAAIYYTTNGSTPTTSSTVYSSPLTENVSGVTIKAIAVKEDMINSAVATGSVTLQCAKPIIARIGDNATINCSFPSSGVSIYYTKNGGTPSSSSTLYSSSIPVTTGDVIRAIAIASGYANSVVTEKTIHDELTPTGGVYYINNDADFESFVEMANEDDGSSYHYELTANVSASTAIAHSFTGIFDGAGYTITGLTHPLFNTVNDGTVKNVMLDDVGISSGTNVGAVCGEATGDSRIYNCGVLATGSTVTTDEDGYTKITTCSSTISGSNYVGGIVGLLDGTSRVINCFSYANVSGGAEVGGIVGHNNVATTATNLKTMVMNCMFYGEVSGTSIAPIYNGTKITNVGENTGVSSFNYFRLEAAYIQNTDITKVYNCALGAETRFLQRFEFFRHLLNSNRELAAWWASTSSTAVTKGEIMKWVLEPSQISSSTPYPILKTPGKYASVVNYDAASAQENQPRNKGGKLGTLSVTIQMGSGGAQFAPPTGAAITTSSLTLNITDKDFEHFNFNYYKVQLPYYNDVGTKNYNGNRVVTGWKIVSITGGTEGSFTTGDDATTDASGNITSTPYNFADRHCTNKDLYSVSGRVFSQGAYWDVPEGVTAITIEPYWAKCTYLSDAYHDVTYNTNWGDITSFTSPGTRYQNNHSYSIAGSIQTVYTSKDDAISRLNSNSAHTVFDYAVVLVGNYHVYTGGNSFNQSDNPYTLTTIDLDCDNEPDYAFICQIGNRSNSWQSPIRFDFLNAIPLGMAQKPNGANRLAGLGIFKPRGWFEITNTTLMRYTEFEYEWSSRLNDTPLILNGGIFEEFVSIPPTTTMSASHTSYIILGQNAWFLLFNNGAHGNNGSGQTTAHCPISVQGGDYESFYVTGYFNSLANELADGGECYVSGGRFGELAGSGMESFGGDMVWQIYSADIDNFYGGGINPEKTIKGNIVVEMHDSHVGVYCGGLKFGDMPSGKSVTTRASGCTFGTFFGAGYGGSAYYVPRELDRNPSYDYDWQYFINNFFRRAYYNNRSMTLGLNGGGQNDSHQGVLNGTGASFEYEFFAPPGFTGDNMVVRFRTKYASLSLATTRNVYSYLDGCTISGNFYGGGNLGLVDGNVTSVLTDCTVMGHAFGAGFQATAPVCPVMPKPTSFPVEPYYNRQTGAITMGTLPATIDYTWKHGDPNVQAFDDDNHYIFTLVDMSDLGRVNGNATLTIDGNSVVRGNVFGGGDMSGVGADAAVTLGGNARVLGNIFGGGNRGAIDGESSVTIQD